MQSARAVEVKHIKGTIVGTKMRLARHVESEDTWQEGGLSGNAKTPRHRSPKDIGKGSGKGKGKGKGKKRTQLKHVCALERKDTRKQTANKTAKCSNSGEVGHLRVVCRNTNTHMRLRRMQMNPVQKSLSKLFGAWLAVRDTVDDGHCDCIEKADVM